MIKKTLIFLIASYAAILFGCQSPNIAEDQKNNFSGPGGGGGGNEKFMLDKEYYPKGYYKSISDTQNYDIIFNVAADGGLIMCTAWRRYDGYFYSKSEFEKNFKYSILDNIRNVDNTGDTSLIKIFLTNVDGYSQPVWFSPGLQWGNYYEVIANAVTREFEKQNIDEVSFTPPTDKTKQIQTFEEVADCFNKW